MAENTKIEYCLPSTLAEMVGPPEEGEKEYFAKLEAERKDRDRLDEIRYLGGELKRTQDYLDLARKAVPDLERRVQEYQERVHGG